jgi:hypothetical protein
MPKVSSTKKSSSVAKKEISIKYEDKSKGHPEMILIFEKLKSLFLPYEKGAIKIHGGTDGKIMLVSHKPIEVEGRKKPEVWFVSALVQKGFVGFYYMPIYGYKKLGEQLRPELMKCLKGKACFHIKKYDEAIFEQIKEALKIGYECYKKLGWV